MNNTIYFELYLSLSLYKEIKNWGEIGFLKTKMYKKIGFTALLELAFSNSVGESQKKFSLAGSARYNTKYPSSAWFEIVRNLDIQAKLGLAW